MTDGAGEILGEIIGGIFEALIEFPIILGIIIVGSIVTVTCMANCWYDTDVVQRRIKELDPSIVTSQQLERNMLSQSIIQGIYANGHTVNICVDSNITFYVRFTNCADGTSFPSRPH